LKKQNAGGDDDDNNIEVPGDSVYMDAECAAERGWEDFDAGDADENKSGSSKLSRETVDEIVEEMLHVQLTRGNDPKADKDASRALIDSKLAEEYNKNAVERMGSLFSLTSCSAGIKDSDDDSIHSKNITSTPNSVTSNASKKSRPAKEAAQYEIISSLLCLPRSDHTTDVAAYDVSSFRGLEIKGIYSNNQLISSYIFKYFITYFMIDGDSDESLHQKQQQEDISPLTPPQGTEFFEDFIVRLKEPKEETEELIDIVEIMSTTTSRSSSSSSSSSRLASDVPPTYLIDTSYNPSLDTVTAITLNTVQQSVCEKIHHNVIHNINHFVDPTTTATLAKPVYLMIQGGPGSGKTTLFKEIVRRIRATLRIKRARLIDMVEHEMSSVIVTRSKSTTISPYLRGMIERMNKVGFGIKQCATTGAAAIIVGNKCVTLHTLNMIPIIKKKKEDVKQATIIKVSDNYRTKCLSLAQKTMYQEMYSNAGCYCQSIDEVSHDTLVYKLLLHTNYVINYLYNDMFFCDSVLC
jgi:hypothetical protein